jgi:hypothetical protein
MLTILQARCCRGWTGYWCHVLGLYQRSQEATAAELRSAAQQHSRGTCGKVYPETPAQLLSPSQHRLALRYVGRFQFIRGLLAPQTPLFVL